MSVPHWLWPTDFPFRLLAEPIQVRLLGEPTNCFADFVHRSPTVVLGFSHGSSPGYGRLRWASWCSVADGRYPAFRLSRSADARRDRGRKSMAHAAARRGPRCAASCSVSRPGVRLEPALLSRRIEVHGEQRPRAKPAITLGLIPPALSCGYLLQERHHRPSLPQLGSSPDHC
jgi:hypothetical protein